MSRSRMHATLPTAVRRWCAMLAVTVVGTLALLVPAPAQAATFRGTLAHAVAAVPTAAEANTVTVTTA